MKIDFLISEYKNCLNVSQEITEVLKLLDASLIDKQVDQGRIVRLIVFYNPDNPEYFLPEIKEKVNRYLQHNIPISYVAQPPQNGQNFIIETGFVKDKKVTIEYFKLSDIKYAKASINFEEHIFVSGLQNPDLNAGIQEQTEFAFKALEKVFKKEDFAFTDIIRQWNYIEGIVDNKSDDQNYQIFNDVRTQFYDKHGLNSRYPAATGIGVKEGGVVLEVYALKGCNNSHVAEIANPLQIDAFKYSEKVLKGTPIVGLSCKTTPKFSRAKWVSNSKSATVFVSGTASILGEEAIGLDNIEEQTNCTIDNILQLIDPELLSSVNVACENVHPNFAMVRVYMKNQAYFRTVQRICEQKINSKNIIYVEADVCRENLLVEIESLVNFDFNT